MHRWPSVILRSKVVEKRPNDEGMGPERREVKALGEMGPLSLQRAALSPLRIFKVFTAGKEH